jgi:hypothetical protein
MVNSHIELGNPSPEKFIEKWYELRLEYDKDELAWEAVERFHKSVFQRNRYSSYNSFRNARDKFNSRNKNITK